ncbi:hypothetical protein OQA88_1638 [Cercophora sp. LCS_1]
MATSVPLSLKQQVPVTPPPDQHMFPKGPFPSQFPQSDFSRSVYEATGMRPPQDAMQMPPPPVTSSANPVPTSASGGPEVANGININTLRDPAVDPRYLAMASRIASYYQQRCQAVANFQQQRCQAWANAQRQKCQEMMQAAMLIVAWYIRDRISRRRRKQKRSFKRGLQQRCKTDAKNKITKGESVRRWVMNVPLGATTLPHSESPEEKKPLDKEEEAFEMDKDDQMPDKDAQLFSLADGMIKSQLARIDVPLLGVLSFDESDDSDSDDDEEEEEEEEEEEDDMEDDNFEQAEDEEMGEEEEEEEYEDEDADGEADDAAEEEVVTGSKSVHLGSTKGSRKRTSSCLS